MRDPEWVRRAEARSLRGFGHTCTAPGDAALARIIERADITFDVLRALRLEDGMPASCAVAAVTPRDPMTVDVLLKDGRTFMVEVRQI